MGSGTEVVVLSDDPVLSSLVRDLLHRERLAVTEAGGETDLRAALAGPDTPILVVDGILWRDETRALLDRLPVLCHGREQPSVLLLTGSGAPAELRDHPSVTANLVAPFASIDLVRAVHSLRPVRRDRSETRLRVATPMPEDGTG